MQSQINNNRAFHITAAVESKSAGRYRRTRDRKFGLTYEMLNPPHLIVARKSWNSWNTCMVQYFSF